MGALAVIRRTSTALSIVALLIVATIGAALWFAASDADCAGQAAKRPCAAADG